MTGAAKHVIQADKGSKVPTALGTEFTALRSTFDIHTHLKSPLTFAAPKMLPFLLRWFGVSCCQRTMPPFFANS